MDNLAEETMIELLIGLIVLTLLTISTLFAIALKSEQTQRQLEE